MNNYRKISFDIDFAGKKVLNTIQMPLEELTQNDFNSSLLTLKLMQGQELINLQGLSVVLNFLMPSGKDYVDTINAEMIDIENSIVSYSIPKDILSEVGMVVGTVSLYKEGYRYTSIVQFKFEVVSDFVEDGEIVESDNYPILAQMIGEVRNLKDEEMKRVESEIERIENEEERESSELQREMNEVERHEAENVRIINEQNREVKELERDQAERLREANSAKVKREEETRLEAETLRVQAESLRIEAESDRIQAESIRQMQESDRHEKELERQAAENLRVLAEIEREQKQNEFNARAEEVAVRIEEESQRISDLVEIEESKLVKPNDMVDYMGNQHSSLKAKSDSDVDYAVKTAIGEFNYLDYEGQHITATNSIEGHARSAILKGCTLVNVVPNKVIDYEATSDWSGYNALAQPTNDGQYYSWISTQDLKPNTKYLVRCYVEKLSTTGDQHYFLNNKNDATIFDEYLRLYNTGLHQWVLTSKSEFTEKTALVLRCQNATARGQIKIKDIMVIEYQEGMENWDIPYFEGMTSVKMPVLKTTGKNLFDKTKIIKSDFEYEKYQHQYYGKEIQLKPNTTYTIKPYLFEEITNTSFWTVLNIINNGKKLEVLNVNKTGSNANDKMLTATFTTNETGKIGYSIYSHQNSELSWLGNLPFEIQLEEGTEPTSYEPYKSNILTTPEEVVLRSLPNGVCDTFNLNTGECIQRIGEITAAELEPGDYYKSNLELENTIQFGMLTRGKEKLRAKTNAKSVCNIIPIMSGNDDVFHARFDGGSPYSSFTIWIDKTKLETEDVFGLIKWLRDNNAVIQYELATPVIKTVDLSDNVVYSYNGTTHYSCSSEEGSLVPTLSVKVPTDVQEVISEQRKIIGEQEEAQNILIDSQLSLYESISGVQTLQTDGEEVQMPQYIIDLYELAYKRGIRKKGER